MPHTSPLRGDSQNNRPSIQGEEHSDKKPDPDVLQLGQCAKFGRLLGLDGSGGGWEVLRGGWVLSARHRLRLGDCTRAHRSLKHQLVPGRGVRQAVSNTAIAYVSISQWVGINKG